MPHLYLTAASNESSMERGVFITLGEESAVDFSLQNGLFGQYLSPTPDNPSYRHYRTLADYGSLRQGDHVFLFQNRQIWYGGTVQGTSDSASFIINGQQSPLGIRTDAPLALDPTLQPSIDKHEDGVFTVSSRDGDREFAQPYLLQFDTNTELSGTSVSSDAFYHRLSSKYENPFPTNVLRDQTFTLMTPAETDELLNAIMSEGTHTKQTGKCSLGRKRWFQSDDTVDKLSQRQAEAHLEALLLANPSMRPEPYRTNTGVWCRQIPATPHKPNVDHVDIGVYDESSAVPSTVLELKHSRAGSPAANQINRYAEWFDRLSEPSPMFGIIAPSFASTFEPALDVSVTTVAFDD